MQYVSPLKNSLAYRRIIKIVMTLLALPPILVLLVLIFLIQISDAKWGDIPSQMLIVMAALVPFAILSIVIVRYILNRQMNLRVDINDDGVYHMAPGKQKNLSWSELKNIKVVKNGNKSMIVLVGDGKYYYLNPFLVPDDPGAPHMILGITGPKWKFIDGRIEPVTLENAEVYQLVRQRRPDLVV